MYSNLMVDGRARRLRKEANICTSRQLPKPVTGTSVADSLRHVEVTKAAYCEAATAENRSKREDMCFDSNPVYSVRS